MDCSICKYLECALESRHSEYIDACSGAFRQITSKLEAYDLVEMERARSELLMHRSVCAYTIAAANPQHLLEALRPLNAAASPLILESKPVARPTSTSPNPAGLQ